MNEEMIRRWNARVHKRDTVYVIGDFSFGGKEATKAVLQRLNGKKILIKGNHDKPAHWMIEAGFDEVHENIYINLGDKQNGTDVRVYLSHFPYRPTFIAWLKHKLTGGYWDTRYIHKRMVDDGGWLIHGHTHSRKRIRGRQIHVGVDAWDYNPVPHTTILKMIQDTKPRKGSLRGYLEEAIIRFKKLWLKEAKHSTRDDL